MSNVLSRLNKVQQKIKKLYTQDDWTMDEIREFWFGEGDKTKLLKKYECTTWNNHDYISKLTDEELDKAIVLLEGEKDGV